jgi:hypothetical protein
MHGTPAHASLIARHRLIALLLLRRRTLPRPCLYVTALLRLTAIVRRHHLLHERDTLSPQQ